jgi:signal transduction histidine kinase
MRLAVFIKMERERILEEWEAFARTLGAVSESMDIAALRDHASEMLTVIAADLETRQTPNEQHEKSVGNAPEEGTLAATAAEEHGADRAERGFTIEQMVSEYRALRASVIRLWVEERGDLAPADVADLTRFHEAIDQSLAESVTRYTTDLDQSREMFVAILGHDLRTPLGAIITAAQFMLDSKELPEPHLTLTSRVASSAQRMDWMVGDLLDLTRSRLGGGIPIERDEMDIEEAVRDVVSELDATHPQAIEVSSRGNVRGSWDGARMRQVLANLVGNALEHGAPDAPVHVDVRGDSAEVTIAVHNEGEPIPPSLLSRIFDPMKRRPTSRGRKGRVSSGLGLGLYIAERIVAAHNGSIAVGSSAAAGTTFTVRLPRQE